jgi:hypothetical protein
MRTAASSSHSLSAADTQPVLHHLDYGVFLPVYARIALRFEQFFDFALGKILRDRDRKGDNQARIAGRLRARGEFGVDRVGRVAMDPAAAAAAEKLRGAREKQLKVVV